MEVSSALEERAKKDFRVFVWAIFKHFLWDVQKDPTPVQYDIAGFLAGHPATHKVIMAFRGIGKSYIAALYCIWRLWGDPTLSVLIISASKERSDQSSTFMLRLLKDVPFLQHLDPDKQRAKGARTSKLSFDVVGAGNKQSPSVRSAGILGMITGSRADIILADDVEIPNNSDTPIKRSKLRTSIEEFEAIIRTGEGKEVIFLGTPQSQESIYNELPSGGKHGYVVRIWPAEYPPNGAMVNYYGDRLSPMLLGKLNTQPDLAGTPTDTRFDKEELEKRKARYGKSGYALQFQLNTTLSDELKYPLKCRDLIFADLDDDNHPEKPVWGTSDENMIIAPCQGFEGDHYFRPIQMLGDWRPYEGGVLAIDPSGRGTDETAYCALKWGNGFLYVLDCGGVSGGFEEEALIQLAKIAKRWGIGTVLPERNMGGGMFGELLRPVLRNHAPQSSVPAVEDLPFHTKQKELRMIETLEPVMNMHRLVFNKTLIEKDLEVQTDVGEEQAPLYRLFMQMTRLTKDRGALPHDDRIDALSMAVAWAQRALGNDPIANAKARKTQEEEESIFGYLTHKPDFRQWGVGRLGHPPAPEKGSNWVT